MLKYKDPAQDVREAVTQGTPNTDFSGSSAQPVEPVQVPGDVPVGLRSVYSRLIGKLSPTQYDGREIHVDSSDSRYRAGIRKNLIFQYSPQTFMDLELQPKPGSILAMILDERRKFMSQPRSLTNVQRPYFKDGWGLRQLFDKIPTLIHPNRIFQNSRVREARVREAANATQAQIGPHNNVRSTIKDVDMRAPVRVDIQSGPYRSSQQKIDRPVPAAQLAASDHGTLVDTVRRIARGLSNDPKTIKFSPFRIPVYKRKSDADLTRNEAAGGIQDKEIPTGRYLFTFEVPHVGGLPPLVVSESIPFKWQGKQMVVEKAIVNPATGEIRMQIEVVENFILIGSLVVAGLAAAGFAGYGLEKSLKQVDKIIVDTGKNSMKIVTAAAIGAGVWLAFPVIKRKAVSV